jgi:hypothetical protein
VLDAGEGTDEDLDTCCRAPVAVVSQSSPSERESKRREQFGIWGGSAVGERTRRHGPCADCGGIWAVTSPNSSFAVFFLFIIISLILLHTYLFSFFIHITLPMVNAHWFKIMRNRNSIYLNMANKKKNLFLFSYGGTFFSLYRA